MRTKFFLISTLVFCFLNTHLTYSMNNIEHNYNKEPNMFLSHPLENVNTYNLSNENINPQVL